MEGLCLQALTLEQKLGQVIMARGYRTPEEKEFLLEMVGKKAVGGIQIAFTDGWQDFVREVHAAADYPILLYNDMERGFPKGQRIPSAIALGAVNDPEIAYEAARVTAIEAKAAGLNAVCGPVVDISCPGALCKVPRTFGDDVETISALGRAMIRGYQDEGMLVMAKHYPGGSDMKDDPHIRDGVSMLTEEELLKLDLIPYLDAIEKEDLTGIMTGHVMFPRIDPVYPATLSPKLISIIRKAGFKGLLITDSMAMMGICRRFGERETLGLAMAAGHDLVLPSYRLSFKESFEALKESFAQGVFTMEQLDTAVARVIEYQNRFRKPATAGELTQAQKDRMDQLNENILCARLREGQSLPLDRNKKYLFVVTAENEYTQLTDDGKEIALPANRTQAQLLPVVRQLKETFPGCETEIIQEFPNQHQIQTVCDRANHCDGVVFFTFAVCSSYYADESLTKRMEYLMGTLEGKLEAIVHVGNPYAVEPFQNVRRLLVGFATPYSEVSAIRALAGEYTPPYQLPVRFRPEKAVIQ